MSQPISFKLGERGETFLRNVPAHLARVNKPVPGHRMAFYELDWELPQLGTMEFVHGEHSFVIDNVMGFMGSELDIEGSELSTPNKGLSDFGISFCTNNKGSETHTEARDGIYGFMKRLQAAGWKRFIAPYDPRIKGQHAMGYRFSYDSSYDLDPSYVPTLSEWVKGHGKNPLGSTNPFVWRLWANGVYIRIGFFRGHPKFSQSGQPGEQEPASYLFKIKIQNEAEYLIDNIELNAREDWRQTWATTSANLKKRRAELEAGMKKTDTPAKHWMWDTQYQDPPILALQVARLTAKVGQPAPKAGWWKASSATNNSRIWNLENLKKSVPERLKQGEPLPSLSLSIADPQKMAEQDADTVWTWIQE